MARGVRGFADAYHASPVAASSVRNLAATGMGATRLLWPCAPALAVHSAGPPPPTHMAVPLSRRRARWNRGTLVPVGQGCEVSVKLCADEPSQVRWVSCTLFVAALAAVRHLPLCRALKW